MGGVRQLAHDVGAAQGCTLADEVLPLEHEDCMSDRPDDIRQPFEIFGGARCRLTDAQVTDPEAGPLACALGALDQVLEGRQQRTA